MTTSAYALARNAQRESLKQLWVTTSAHVAEMVDSIPKDERLEQLSLALTSEMIGRQHPDEAQQMLIEHLADALRSEAQLARFVRNNPKPVSV
jgi:hypothetical protein